MKLGFFTMPIHPVGRKLVETLNEDRELAVIAEKLGFIEGFYGEHMTDAAETITSCLMFIAWTFRLPKTPEGTKNRNIIALGIFLFITFMEEKIPIASASNRTPAIPRRPGPRGVAPALLVRSIGAARRCAENGPPVSPDER